MNYNYTINSDRIAVADAIYIQPMETCPINAEVMLLSSGGNMIRGRWDGKSQFWQGWFPFPRRIKQEIVKPEPLITHKEYLG